MTGRTGLAGSRVVVTGGRGFLGRAVTEVAREQGAQVVALGRADHDLTEPAQVRAMFDRLRPDLIVHAAAAVGGIAANVAHPAGFLYRNALMGLLVLEEARRAGLTKLVLVSTTCTYPAVTALPMRESSIWDGRPSGATGAYGIAKRMLHEACATYAEEYGLDSAVLVLANLYGPGDHTGPDAHVVPMLIERFLEARRTGAPVLTNWGTGRATREFLHVRDAARAVVLALGRDTGPAPINVGTGRETTIAELAELIRAATGYEGEVRWDPTEPEGQSRRVLDVSRARELLGWEAEIPLAEGIRETVASFLARNASA